MHGLGCERRDDLTPSPPATVVPRLFGHLGRREPEHVAQDQHCPLARREML
jgi:hypothetical protein